MSLAQDKWVLAATVIAESAWLYAAFGVVGLPVAGTGSPLGWFAVLAVLASSLIVARVLQVIVLPAAVAPGIYAVLGILVIYLTFGGQFTAGNSFDLFWVGQLTQEVQAQNFWASVVVAAVMASGLWWRGGALASAEYPDEVLLLSFKIGIVALGIAVVMDAAYSADLNTYPMMFIFIASALGGLAIGRLSPSSARTATKRAWPRVIGGVVSAVLVLGPGVRHCAELPAPLCVTDDSVDLAVAGGLRRRSGNHCAHSANSLARQLLLRVDYQSFR